MTCPDLYILQPPAFILWDPPPRPGLSFLSFISPSSPGFRHSDLRRTLRQVPRPNSMSLQFLERCTPLSGDSFSDSHPALSGPGASLPQDRFPQGPGLYLSQAPRYLRLGHEQYSCPTPDPGTQSFEFYRPKCPSIPHCLPNSGVLTVRMPLPGATQAPFSSNVRPSATSRGTPTSFQDPPLVLTSLRAGRTLRAAGPAAA